MPSQKRTRQKLTSSQKRTSRKPTSSENLAWSKWTDPSRDRSGGFEALQVGWLSDRSLRDERAAGRRWSSGVERMVHGELRGPVPREAPAWCLQTARPRVEVVEVGPGGVQVARWARGEDRVDLADPARGAGVDHAGATCRGVVGHV